MVSYSNYKRHLKNAHPSLNHDKELAEIDRDETGNTDENTGQNNNKYLGHEMDEDDDIEEIDPTEKD